MPIVDLFTLAERLAGLPPSCGPVRVVAVDGPSGAGKSTFARRLGAVLAAPVVGSDQFRVPWESESPLVWWEPFAEQVLTPLAAGRAGGFRPFSWRRGGYGEWLEIPVTPVLIVEGVGAAWRESPAAYRIWLDAPRKLRRARVIGRDGGELGPRWDRWSDRETAHFAADRTEERADLRIDGVSGERLA
ncbi:uridine kinase family protein [Nocardia arthritidis]|uniref:Uncharacterized protein n=1 Tax=Nocardia arthritidis TaxID=228602 RepID=A0A6G9YL05_9NOCA|nr:(d)CMP kinase [Nocardia arthritidis]QIS13861.1 hypothetical protein F5544_30080 [Nocardia arthritidis]